MDNSVKRLQELVDVLDNHRMNARQPQNRSQQPHSEAYSTSW